jgi:apolipoprotein N-acyltransferase
LEMLRGWLLGGFPWNLLGTAFYKSLPLVQLASWTGVYGLSFLSVWASLALVSATLAIAFRKDSRWAWTAELRVPLICVLILGSVGVRRIMSGASETGSVRLALIQPSIPQTLIWDPTAATNRYEQILALSKRALENPVDAIVWPEGSLPEIDRDQFERMLAVTRPKAVKWILGGDETEKTDGELKVYNSGFLIGTNGQLESTYRKRRLVIFGEYVPLEKSLPFLKYLTPIGGSFSEGKGPVGFELGAGKGVASPVICFEDVFPHGARTHVHAGIDVLLELTNDGWFGEGSAQWQHLAAAVFRAAENGVPVVRCTNTGITCWIDRYGRVREILQVDGINPYGAGYLIAEVPLGTQKEATLYREKGDWFGLSCVAVTLYSWLRNQLGRNQIRGIRGGEKESLKDTML